MLGEDIAVPYWEDTQGSRTLAEKLANKAHRLYFRGIVDTARKLWLLPRMEALAQLYHLTHDEKYAKRLILILDEFAKRYPHYLLTTDYANRYASTKGKKLPYGYVDTRWGRRSGDDVPNELLSLFDLAASSPSMDAATKRRIISQLFLEPLKRLDLWGTDSDDLGFYGNICPLKPMAELALVLEDPERVHVCYNRIKNTPRYASGCDGMYNQSPGYSSLFRLTFFEGARILNGYSDPPGFVGSDGLHLENIQPVKEMEDYFHRLCTVSDQLRLPSGGWVSYDDAGPGFGPTWWSGYGESCRPLERSSNVLLPGLKRATLGAGSGDKQIQVALDFAEHGVNHGHQSGLSMQIYAFGHSLVDDFPYHKSTLRLYSSKTIGHPTVVIDHKNQNTANTSGDVELYAPLMDGVSAIRVDNTRAYAGVAQRYARTLILNAIDADAPYVIDVFEVIGGTLHDYHLRSSSQHHSSATSSLAMQPLPGLRPLLPPGEKWVEPRKQREPVGSGYGLLFDVSQAAITSPFNFTSVCDDPWAIVKEAKSKIDNDGSVGAYLAGPDSWPDRPAIGIRHHVAVAAGYEFISANSPSLVEAGFSGIKDKPADQWPKIPHRILRHKVKAGGSSAFVVVHEPYHGAPKISSVTRLDSGDDNLVALRIESPGRVDTVLYALDRSREVAAGGVSMSGRIGLVSRQEKQPPRAYLIEGTRLKAEGVDLKNSTADYAGSITAMQRSWEGKGVNRMRVNSNSVLPEGDTLQGSWMLVKLGPWTSTMKEKAENGEESEEKIAARNFPGATQALEIDHVAVDGEGTWIYIKGDHGLSIQDRNVEEFYWPRRIFAGEPRFIIPTAVTTNPLPLPPRPKPVLVEPLASVPAGMKPGIKVTSFTGTGHDVKTQNKISDKILQKADENVLEAMLESMKLPGAIKIEGYLQVPADGLYSFHFGCTDEFRMTIGNVTAIETFRGRSLMPEIRELQLAKGWYPVTLECFRSAKSRIPVWLTTDWEGPGLPRQDFIPALKQ
jgi:hypothetical protein